MIEIDKQHDMGGIIEIYAINRLDVIRTTGGVIVIKAGSHIYHLNSQTESNRHIAKPDRSTPGDFWQHAISGFIPGRIVGNEDVFQKMARNRFVVAYKDGSGNYYLLGNQSMGLGFEFEFDTRNDPSAVQGYSFTFSGSFLSNSLPCYWPPNEILPD